MYKVIKLSIGTPAQDIEQVLNSYANDGWYLEQVSVADSHGYILFVLRNR